MRRSRPIQAKCLEEIQNALWVASNGLKQARRRVKQLAVEERRKANAHHNPCRGRSKWQRAIAHRQGMRIITARPGHEPDPEPPIGERWVHIGGGTFIPLSAYKRHRKEVEEKKIRDWNWNQ